MGGGSGGGDVCARRHSARAICRHSEARADRSHGHQERPAHGRRRQRPAAFKWQVSTGKRGFDTPRGSYKVSWLDEHHKSKQYSDAPMPYSIFFDNGRAIHGFAGGVGGPASHGCVRLSTGNAKTLFRLVEQEQGLAGFKYDTSIIVR